MRFRTGILVVLVFAALLGVGWYGFSLVTASDGDLHETWVSDTARANDRNHHAVGVGPNGSVVVAPVAGVPGVDEMTNATCSLVRLAPSNGTVLWRTGMPAERCFSHALTEPAIEDLDGDGTLEVIVGTTENATIVYDAGDGSEEFRIPTERYGYSRPTVANLTASPGKEIVTVDLYGNLVVATATGTPRWHHSFGEIVYAEPVVRDVDGDGSRDVLVSALDRTVLLNANGEVQWTVPVGGYDLVTAQADRDDQPEVYVTDTASVVALDGKTGEREWTADRRGSPRLHAVTDGDGDGTVEVYLSRTDGRVTVLEGTTGDEEWTTTVARQESPSTPPPVVGDVTGDGQPDLVAVTGSGTVAVLDPASGEERAAYDRDVPIRTYPTLANVDDDPAAEILARYGDGRVVLLNYRGGDGG
ncbi:outer membrane protein assembly factor BamB family protein [Halomarina pelagica]|uniref:outer membrane protein assembly factor BamB family protein n=1 Tax=Halomarina pelagica TaxID=2961599 RepID=UPI0020C23A88|nr:PQQ-binding-like beta-propeller repeat protein [Halomarina sp. BND7]